MIYVVKTICIKFYVINQVTNSWLQTLLNNTLQSFITLTGNTNRCLQIDVSTAAETQVLPI